MNALDPWVWAAAGVVLLIAELLVQGYLLSGIGLAAFVVAVGLALVPGLAAELPAPLMTLVIAALLIGMAFWAVLAWLAGRFARHRNPDRDINDFVNHG